MQKSIGVKIHHSRLVTGERYIMRVGKSEVLVKVEVIRPDAIGVVIEEGSIKSLKLNQNIGKNAHYAADPAIAEFFEPQV